MRDPLRAAVSRKASSTSLPTFLNLGSSSTAQRAAFHTSAWLNNMKWAAPTTPGRRRTESKRSQNAQSLIQRQLNPEVRERRQPQLNSPSNSNANVSQLEHNDTGEDADVDVLGEIIPQVNADERGPKINVLEQAARDGLLEMDASVAGNLLWIFRYSSTVSPDNLQKNCAKLGISVDAVYTLAQLLTRSRGAADRLRGKQLLLAASKLGSVRATLHVVETALKTKQLSKAEVEPSLAHLIELTDASVATPNVMTLVAQAKVLEVQAQDLISESKNDEADAKIEAAAKMCSRAIELSKAGPIHTTFKPGKDQVIGSFDIVAAHMTLASLQYFYDSNVWSEDSAKENWRTAAVVYEEPLAHFELAKCFAAQAKLKCADPAPENDDYVDCSWMRYLPYEWYDHTLKAAVSGLKEACYQMAVFHSLEHFGHAEHIEDQQLRAVILDNPLLAGRTEQLGGWSSEELLYVNSWSTAAFPLEDALVMRDVVSVESCSYSHERDRVDATESLSRLMLQMQLSTKMRQSILGSLSKAPDMQLKATRAFEWLMSRGPYRQFLRQIVMKPSKSKSSFERAITKYKNLLHPSLQRFIMEK